MTSENALLGRVRKLLAKAAAEGVTRAEAEVICRGSLVAGTWELRHAEVRAW